MVGLARRSLPRAAGRGRARPFPTGTATGSAFARTVGLQFHPEVDAATVDRWVGEAIRDFFERHSISPAVVLDALDEHVARAEPACTALVDWYLDAVVGAPQPAAAGSA